MSYVYWYATRDVRGLPERIPAESLPPGALRFGVRHEEVDGLTTDVPIYVPGDGRE
jgi:hypothetical protein